MKKIFVRNLVVGIIAFVETEAIVHLMCSKLLAVVGDCSNYLLTELLLSGATYVPGDNCLKVDCHKHSYASHARASEHCSLMDMSYM